MDKDLINVLINLGVTGVAVVLWWLLRQKDAKQEEAIKLLFKKHDDEARRHDDLRLEIARQHYVKPELDSKFDKLEASIKEGMDSLGKKFDRLSEVLISEAHRK